MRTRHMQHGKTTPLLVLMCLLGVTLSPFILDTTHAQDDDGWIITKIANIPDNEACPSHGGPTAVINTDREGVIGGIIRDCESAFNLNGTVFVFDIATQDMTLVDNSDYWDGDMVGHGHAQVRYDPDNEVFYACTSGFGTPTRFHKWTSNGTLLTPAGGRLVMVGSEFVGGPCSPAHIPNRPNAYQMVVRLQNDHWAVFNTRDNFENQTAAFPTGFQGGVWPGPAVMVSSSPLLRAWNPPSSPNNDTVFAQWWRGANLITHNFCRDWQNLPCWDMDAGQLVDDIGLITYRELGPGAPSVRGVAFSQQGFGQADSSFSWSASIWHFWGSTGEGPDTQENLHVLALDRREWLARQAVGFTINEHDEISAAAGLTGKRTDLDIGTDEDISAGRWDWKRPCIWAEASDVVVTTFHATDVERGLERLPVVGSTDSGTSWRGLRSAITEQTHDGRLQVSWIGGCILYDDATGSINIIYKIDESGGDGGYYIATNDVESVLLDFRGLDWSAFTGADLSGGSQVTWFGVPLTPWADAWGIEMVGLQIIMSIMLMIVFAGSFMRVIDNPLLGGLVGAVFGLILAISSSIVGPWLLAAMLIIGVAIFLIAQRFLSTGGGAS
jgi:hypothetical protein